jgi:hypothetical protein
MATTGYGDWNWGQGFGSYLGNVGLTTSAATGSGHIQRYQSQHYADSMRYAMQNMGSAYKFQWDDDKIKKIQESDYYGREGERKTILQRLRKETYNFIGDRMKV